MLNISETNSLQTVNYFIIFCVKIRVYCLRSDELNFCNLKYERESISFQAGAFLMRLIDYIMTAWDYSKNEKVFGKCALPSIIWP